MKKILLAFIALGVSISTVYAFPETSSANTEQMYQLQNLDRFKDPSMTDFKNYRAKREQRKQQVKRAEERREYLEQRATTINNAANVQFVNENGVIKIERK